MQTLDQLGAKADHANAKLDQVDAKTERRIPVDAAHTGGDKTNTFIISKAGSYYFTGNITGAAGKHGISIRADDVTLDLNGFALISGGSGTLRGIDVPAAQTNICIRNGAVRGWTGDGIHAQAATMLAEKLLLSNNTGANGLAVGNGSMVKDCVSAANATGFLLPDRTQVSNCIATVNTGVGFKGTSFVTVVDCTSSRNGADGFDIASGGSAIRCNASRNFGNGIKAGSGCTIADCTLSTNQDGVSVDFGSTIRNCTAQANKDSGIRVGTNCLIIGNTCDENNQASEAGSSGIIVLGAANRIEANSCTSNNGANLGGYGILATVGVDNLIIRNTAHANGANNYAIAAGNRYGTIVDLSGNNPDAVNGNSGSSTVGTSDPWANFAY